MTDSASRNDPDTGGFIYLECRIGERLGLSDSMVKSTRKRFLTPGTDFMLVDGKTAYTKNALDKFIDSLLGCEKTSASTKAKVEAARLSTALELALLEPVLCEKQATEKNGAAEQITDPARLLAVPWKIPNAVLLVTRIFPRNNKIMLGKIDPAWVEKNGAAYKSKTGISAGVDTHRIRVNTTKNFTIGMEVPCIWRQADLWECSCRMPKRKGKWN